MGSNKPQLHWADIELDPHDLKCSKRPNSRAVAVGGYRTAMERKYGTVHWDKFCSDVEWQKFLSLCKEKENLEESIEE